MGGLALVSSEERWLRWFLILAHFNIIIAYLSCPTELYSTVWSTVTTVNTISPSNKLNISDHLNKIWVLWPTPWPANLLRVALHHTSYSPARPAPFQQWSRFSAICFVCWKSRLIVAVESTLIKKKKNQLAGQLRSVSHGSSCIGVMPAQIIIYFYLGN
jgi:hypothetical protein